ncbi:MAG: hypothetical protein IBJ15_08750 [Alphaproteobacteria bacterium]|nr:hypothetical protein [Alphaproteobacteria bacterium]
MSASNRRLATLGSGTNHDFVARQYAQLRGLAPEPLACDTLKACAEAVLAGDADYAVICSVHPDTPHLLTAHHKRLFLADTFISPSKPLAIVTREQIHRPHSVGVFTATLGLGDLSAWREIVIEKSGTIFDVETQLRRGAYDSALVYRDFPDRVPGYRLEMEIESPDDAWLVLGTTRAYKGAIVAAQPKLP